MQSWPLEFRVLLLGRLSRAQTGTVQCSRDYMYTDQRTQYVRASVPNGRSKSAIAAKPLVLDLCASVCTSVAAEWSPAWLAK